MNYTAHLFLGNGFKMEITGTNLRKLEAEARRTLKNEGFPPREDSYNCWTAGGDPVCRYEITDEEENNVTSEYATALFRNRSGRGMYWSAF